MRIRRLCVAAVAGLVVPVAVGCGGDDSSVGGQAAKGSSTATQTTTAQQADGHTLTIRMTDYAFNPANAVAEKGKVTITAPNNGNIVHELVLLKTDADPAKLPKNGDEVDESTSVGEIADVDAGATKKATFRLKPGTYVMVCALPGHYDAGMYGSLAVK